jgi:uncharacterized membrane protein
MQPPPLFSNPPAFVTLAIIMAISGYLHQLAKNREAEIDDIEDGKKDDRFPPGSEERKARLKYLNWSLRRLNVVAIVMILGSIAISIRLTALAYTLRPNGEWAGWSNCLFRWFDFGAMLCLVLILVGLFYIHGKGRAENKKIRKMIRDRRAEGEISAPRQQQTEA